MPSVGAHAVLGSALRPSTLFHPREVLGLPTNGPYSDCRTGTGFPMPGWSYWHATVAVDNSRNRPNGSNDHAFGAVISSSRDHLRVHQANSSSWMFHLSSLWPHVSGPMRRVDGILPRLRQFAVPSVTPELQQFRLHPSAASVLTPK